jgi:ribosomal protein L20A (L18A)
MAEHTQIPDGNKQARETAAWVNMTYALANTFPPEAIEKMIQDIAGHAVACSEYVCDLENQSRAKDREIAERDAYIEKLEVENREVENRLRNALIRAEMALATLANAPNWSVHEHMIWWDLGERKTGLGPSEYASNELRKVIRIRGQIFEKHYNPKKNMTKEERYTKATSLLREALEDAETSENHSIHDRTREQIRAFLEGIGFIPSLQPDTNKQQ